MTRSNIVVAGLVVAALGVAAIPGQAAMTSPFRAMAGSWSGGGTLSMADGEREPLRCRASYDVAETGNEVNLDLRCASASYNFDLTSEAQYRGGAISGSWSEASRNAAGSLSGRGSGDRIDVAARGQNFAANLSLTTRGNRQTISIQPQGQTDIRCVSLALERR
jgi:hypothetical protein